VYLFIGSTFYTAFILKKAPGTVSSLAIFLVFFFFDSLLWEVKIILLLILGLAHFFCFPFFQTRYKDDDPSVYTLDEAFAMILLNIFYPKGAYWVAAFILFRFFDIIKPLGIKMVEEAKGLSSVFRNLFDDILAAIYALVLIKVFEYAF
jgi:phosphatidylglycerophosphatase A